MKYSKEVEEMCIVAKGPKHGPAPIPEEGKWVQMCIRDSPQPAQEVRRGIGGLLRIRRQKAQPLSLIHIS